MLILKFFIIFFYRKTDPASLRNPAPAAEREPDQQPDRRHSVRNVRQHDQTRQAHPDQEQAQEAGGRRLVRSVLLRDRGSIL